MTRDAEQVDAVAVAGSVWQIVAQVPRVIVLQIFQDLAAGLRLGFGIGVASYFRYFPCISDARMCRGHSLPHTT